MRKNWNRKNPVTNLLDNTRRTGGVPRMEPLEPRQLLSLLGVTLTELPIEFYNSTGRMNYDAPTQEFDVAATPTGIFLPTGPRSITATHGDFQIHAKVGGAGQLLRGVGPSDTAFLGAIDAAGDDLILRGSVDLDGNGSIDPATESGDLLLGEIYAFGFEDSGGPTDHYDYKFALTGGLLAQYFTNRDIGVVMTSENSDFVGDFGVTYQGHAKGSVGPIAPPPPSSISGFVYHDSNNDGTFQGTENPIAGTTVALTGINDIGQAVSLTTTTDAAGYYRFGGLRAGTYRLNETQPAGYLDGKDTIGTPGGTTTNDQFDAINLPVGFNGVNNNFGEILASSISGYVYYDANNDGTFQGTESPIGGTTVSLSGTDDLGNAVSASASTNAAGFYIFSGLRPGSYQLTETQPAGYLDGKDTIGTPGGATANDQFSGIALPEGYDGVNNNFGEILASSISGYVYYDANNDGVFQGSESAISGTTVSLSGTDDLGNAVSATASTNAAGFYIFAGLRPGTYQLNETQPAGYLDGRDTIGTPGGTTTNDQFAGINLVAGFNGVNNNFGEILASSISGYVYYDANNDGIFQGTESAISSTTVTLSGTDDLGNSVSATASTNGAGFYLFSGLRPGTYHLNETQPAAYLDGRDTIGTPGGTTTNDQFAGINLVAGFNGVNNNFGEILASSISGFVYYDANNDGTFQGTESAISGTTVSLSGTDDLGNAVNATAGTNGAGFYLFSGLRPGTYRLNETQPAGYLDGRDTIGTPGGTTTNDQFANINLVAGFNGVNNNFGEILASSISGYVYYDANNDGVFQGSESAISGTTVSLSGTDDLGNAVNATASTNAAGFYLFSGLRPGTYRLNETQPAGYLDGRDTVGTPGGSTTNDQFAGINLVAGFNGVNNNFGEILAACLSGYVYYDANNDGVFQGTESPIAGTTVTLSGTDDLGGAVNRTTTTSATGFYAFGGLRPGTYRLNETQPAGYLDGRDTIGTPGGTTTNDQFANINLVAGFNGVNNNFGEILASSISGYVYYDANNDGTFQGTESAISSTTVTLSGTDDLGNAVSTTASTNGAGFYLFSGLRPGTYRLNETQPAGYLDGRDTIGTPGGTTTNDQFANINLVAGFNGVNNNFGEILAACLSGCVYYDANNDGVFQGTESPIAGTTVTLSGTDDLGGAVNRTTTTSATGFYAFGGLRPGTYRLNEAQPAGYLDGRDTIGTPGGTTTNDQFANINLVAGFNGVNNNFGEILAASISGYVYYDANNDGTFQGTESAISGTTVSLSGTDDLGNAVNATASTNAAGFYLFSGLRPGTYRLNETQPAGYLDGRDTIGTPGGTTTNDQFAGITLLAGVNGVNNNFGEVLAASIAGFVYYDANNDGIFQGTESPIVGATVTLTGTDDLGAAVSRTTTSSATGAYSFTGLRPGTYRLNETQPAAYLDGRDTIGTPGGIATNDQFANNVLVAGYNGVNNNFGELLASSLAGFVYYDANNDGTFQGTESPIPGTTVTLTGTDDLGAAVSRTTTTSATGAYSFTGLRPGTYRLNETQPAGYFDGRDTIGTPGGTTTNDQFAGIALLAGVNGVNNNFGEVLASSLSGYVYYDANNDGTFQGTESPIPGATVTLTGTDDLGNAVSQTTTTSATGLYSFTNLRPGSYRLNETQPAAYLDGKDTIGTPGGSTTNDQFGGINLNAGVNGVNNNFGELLPASLSGYVYYDINNDGVFQGTESPIPGTTVTLTGTDDLGGSVSRTTTTSATGLYSFTGLRPGTYRLNETQPAGYIDGIDTIGTPGGVTSNDQFSGINLNAGVNGVNNNFGELRNASISGRKFLDETGNGLTSDDTGFGGVTIYIDANNNGVKDTGELSTVSASDGTFTFSGLGAGTYIVREVVPAGYVRTGPTLSDNYSVTLTTGQQYTGVNFANAEICDKSVLTSYQFLINGDTVVGDLRGNTNQGDEVTVTFTVASWVTSHQFTLVSYTAPGATFDANVANQQRIYEVATGFFGPGVHSLSVHIPDCFYQIDFVCGPAIDVFGPAGGNIFYSAQNRLFSADNDGTCSCNTNCGSISGYVYIDRDNDGVKDAGESGISGVTVTLTGTDTTGAAVSLVKTTDGQGKYTFSNLRAGTYRLAESQPANYNDGIDTLGSLGGTRPSNDVFASIILAACGAGNNYNFGELLCTGTAIMSGDTATIGFWRNCNGQALINSLNGSANATNLGNWLASNFGNLFGAAAGSTYNLAGKTNAQVAAAFTARFSVTGPKTEAQIMAVALATYVTSSTLAGGSYAAAYGFNVSSGGIGSRIVNVGASGSVLSLSNNSTQTVMTILQKANTKASAGFIYAADNTSRSLVNNLFDMINQTGDIN